MKDDAIINEIHKIREKILKENNYNIDEIFKKQKKHLEELKNSGWKIVSKEKNKKKTKVA